MYGGKVASAGLEAVLRDVIEPGIYKIIKDEATGLKLFGVDEGRKWAGRRLLFKLHTRHTGSFSAANEGDTLIGPGAVQYTEGEVFAKYIYGTLAITGQALAASAGGGGAIDALAGETDSLVTTFRRHLDRMLWNRSNGFLCKVGVWNLAALRITVDIAAADAPTDPRFCYEGSKIAWGTIIELAATPAGFGTVTSIDLTNNYVYITVDSGSDPDAADYVVMGDATVNSYDKEFTGLKDVETAGNDLHSVSETSFPTWVPASMTLSGTDVDMVPTVLIKGVNKYKQVNSMYPDLMLGHLSLIPEYFDHVMQDVRYAGSNSAFKTGYSDLAFTAGKGPIPFHFDEYAPYRSTSAPLYLMEKRFFKYSWMVKPGFMTWNSGGDRITPTGLKDEGRAVYRAYGNFFTPDRRRMVKMASFTASPVL